MFLQYPIFVFLFILVGILVFLFVLHLNWKKRVARKSGDPDLIRLLTPDFSKKRYLVKFILCCTAVVFGILAAINPRTPGSDENTQRRGIDVAIALDVSKSMLAEDLLPSRLDRARQFIGKLMNAMPDDRIALVLFAGKAYLQMPLTVDHGAAKMFVSSASPDAVPQQGTVISDALNMSSNVFDNADLRYKSVVLISDGEDHDEAAIETARSLKGRGIMINTVGVGSTEGTTFTDPSTGDIKKDESGSPVVSRLNETTLQAVAAETNGVYVLLNSSDEAVSEIKAQLSQIETRAYTDLSQVEFRNYFPWLTAAMLLLLLVEFFVPETKRLKK